MKDNFIPQEVKEKIRNSNYEISKDIGDVPSRIAGKVGGSLGGTMTKRLVEMAEKDLANKNK